MSRKANSSPTPTSEGNPEYYSAVSGSVREIVALWDRINAQPEAEALKRLHRLAHNLTGACGLLGFLELRQAANMLERRLGELISAETPICREALVEIDSLAEAVRRADPLYGSVRGSQEEE